MRLAKTPGSKRDNFKSSTSGVQPSISKITNGGVALECVGLLDKEAVRQDVLESQKLKFLECMMNMRIMC